MKHVAWQAVIFGIAGVAINLLLARLTQVLASWLRLANLAHLPASVPAGAPTTAKRRRSETS